MIVRATVQETQKEKRLPGVRDTDGAAVGHVRNSHRWRISDAKEWAHGCCQGCCQRCVGCGVCYWSSVSIDGRIGYANVGSASTGEWGGNSLRLGRNLCEISRAAKDIVRCRR